MDLADDIRAQKEIHQAKQELWDSELTPTGKENTDEAKKFVSRMAEVCTKLDALEKEADGEAAKYGNDIVYMAQFSNARNQFGDVTKNLRKSERSIKELSFAADEDRKNHERMQALIDQ